MLANILVDPLLEPNRAAAFAEKSEINIEHELITKMITG